MANNIKKLRKMHDMTLAQLAEKLGVSESTVQRYESGNIKNLKYETISALANIFRCTPGFVMGWEDDYPMELSMMGDVLKVADITGKSVSDILGFELLPEDYEPYGNIRVVDALKNANRRRKKSFEEFLNEPVQISVQSDEYYKLYELLTQAQEMFDDPDMRALFHMKKNMEPEKFKAHVNMMKELYRLEHPEDQGG